MSVLDNMCSMKMYDGKFYADMDDVEPLYDFVEKAEPLIVEMLRKLDASMTRPYTCDWLNDLKRRVRELGVKVD